MKMHFTNAIARINERLQFWKSYPILVFLFLTLAGCNSLIAPYDQTAYENATSIKAEALWLMAKATEPYSDHQLQVDALMLRVEQAYEYAKGIPKNEDSTRQWEILKNPERNLLGGFMKRWRESGHLSEAFIQNACEDLVGPAFDEIIRLESGKIGTGTIDTECISQCDSEARLCAENANSARRSCTGSDCDEQLLDSKFKCDADKATCRSACL